MTTNNTSTVSTTSDRPYVASETECSAIKDGLRTLFEVVRDGKFSTAKNGEKLTLGDFDSLGASEYEVLVVRAIGALRRADSIQANAATRAFRAKVDTALAAAKERGLKSRTEILNMSEETRSTLGISVPDAINVPLSSLSECFEANTAPESMVKQLHNVGVTLARGNHKQPMVRVELVAKSAPKPPTAK